MTPAPVADDVSFAGRQGETLKVGGLTSLAAPKSGSFVIGSGLVHQENAVDFYYPDNPF